MFKNFKLKSLTLNTLENNKSFQKLKINNFINSTLIKNFITINSSFKHNLNNSVVNFSAKNYTFKPKKEKNNSKKEQKKPSLYVGDRVQILPEVGDLKNLSHYEKRMLKYNNPKDTELKVGSILKIKRKKNIALVTNHKLEKKYVDINYLGYFFENNRLKEIKQRNKNVPISLDRLRLFSEIKKDKNKKIVDIKPAMIKYRNDPKKRVDMNNGKIFPVFLPTRNEIEALRQKKHQEKKLTELDTEYQVAIKTTYKGENFEKITKNFVEKIFNKNYIEKNLILNDK